jgi:hypothetical protein
MNQSSQNSASSVRARGADYPFNAKHTDGATTDKDALTLEADLTENTESKASPFLNPSRREAAADNQNRGEPQLNPFAGFLRDWLSPQDLAMLSSSAQATATGLGFASGDGPFSPAGAVLENVSLSPRVPLMDTSFAGGVPPPARPNPFLETLVLPANSIPEIPAPFLSARTETPMAAAPSSMPILPSQASTSLDSAPARPFVPPPLEDNHFPQLRRF